MLGPAEAAAVRTGVNSLCRLLSADNGRVSLQLCDGFGIPEHLLFNAPAASDWRRL